MKRFLIGIGLVVLVLTMAALAAPFLIPAERYKAQLVGVLREATGRDLRIDGPVSLSVLPRLAFQAADVAVAGNDTGHGDLLHLAQLDIAVALRPLLDGRIAVERLLLKQPQVRLAVDEQGRGNWDRPAGQGRTADQDGQGGADRSGPADGPPDIGLGTVRMVGGAVLYTDARSKTAYRIGDIDAELAMPDLASPARVTAAFMLDGRRATLEATIAAPRGLTDGSGSAVTLALAADAGRVTFQGRLQPERKPERAGAKGTLDVAVTAPRDLADWLAPQAVPALPPLTGIALKGALAVSPEQVAMTDAVLTADDMTARGTVALALAGPRPKLSGRLAVSRLDLDRLSNHGPAPESTPAGTPTRPAAETSTAAWSEAPIDVSALNGLDADLDIRLAGLVLHRTEVGATSLTIGLDKGRLTAVAGATPLFGGTMSGRLTADAAARVPAFTLDLKGDGVQAEPLLTRLAALDRLTGAAQVTAALRTQGASIKAMVSALDGQATVILRDGAIKGVNLAAMVRNVTTAFQGSPAETTDFAELGGSFRLADGVATTEDLHLRAPLLRVEGGGRIALPERRVDLRLVPKVVPTIQGQGGRTDVKGLAVPVLVRGPFDNLAFAPDLNAIADEMLRNPEAIRDQVGTVKELLGRGGQGPAQGPLEGLPSGNRNRPGNPAEMLKGILGR